ncbi:MAG: hypothetical protein ACTHU0_03460 [Kofleriaceae bacterium]
MSEFLSTGALTVEHSKIVVEHLLHDPPEREWREVLEAWPEALDRLVYACYRAAASPFRQVDSSGQPWARRGLSLVRRRVGEAIEPEMASALVTALAESWVRGQLRGVSIGWVDEQGAEQELVVADLESARELAHRVDPSTSWQTTTEHAVLAHPWERFQDIAPIVERAPLHVLVAALARGPESGLAEPLAVLDRRNDPPDSLLGAARHEERLPRHAQTLLTVTAVHRSLNQGGSVPDDLEQLVAFAHAAADPTLARRFVEVLRQLPAARVEAWTRARLADDGAVVLAFAAHEDAGLVREVLRTGDRVSPSWFEVLGERVIPTLLGAAGELSDERAAIARHAFVFALAGAVASGSPVDPAWDIELLIAAFEGRPTERAAYRDPLREAIERVLAALPRARRETILDEADPAPMCVVRMLPTIHEDDELRGYLRAAIRRGMIDAYAIRMLGDRVLPALRAYGAEARDPAWIREQAREGLSPEQFAAVADAFEAARGRLWQTVSAEAAAARAALPGAACERVYLLQRASFTWPAREGSRSRVGGRAPTGVRAPRGMFHLMTIDLAEVPELAAWYPNAGGLSVFCTEAPEPDVDAEVIEVPSIAGPGRSAGDALAISAVDVPLEVFGDREALEPALRAIRDRIDHAGGYLLGTPTWSSAAEAPRDDEDFLGTIHETLDHRLNFGDGGILYLYKSTSVFESL